MVKTINRVVIAVDLSGYSAQTLEYGAAVAENSLAEIIIVNVISKRRVIAVEKLFNEQFPGQFSLKKFLNDETNRRTARIEDMVKAVVPEGVPSRVVIRWGVPFAEIIRVTDNERADLLVMSPHGAGDRPGLRMGTTMEKCFRHSRTSLLRLPLRQDH